MNDRQRDLFLWQWSTLRQRGLGHVTLLGTLVGAIGGLVFALVMMDMADVPHRHGLSSLLTVVDVIERSFRWVALSIPPFAVIGMATAYRSFSRNELMYQLLLKGGARVPDQKPILLPGDRWPLYLVIATVVVLIGLVVTLWVVVGTGSNPSGTSAPDAPPIPAPPSVAPDFDFQSHVDRIGSSGIREQGQEDASREDPN